MSTYKVLRQISHDNTLYVEGDKIDFDEKTNADAIDALTAIAAIEKANESASGQAASSTDAKSDADQGSDTKPEAGQGKGKKTASDKAE